MNVQIIDATPQGDKVIAAANSVELKKYGWQAACGNIPAAYLTGLLCGVRAIKEDVERSVADIGLHEPTKGARVFASLTGVIDAGIQVPHKPGKSPDSKRLKGQHIADHAKALASSNPELYQKTFSKYLERKLSPEELPKHFETAKAQIQSHLEKKSKEKNVRKRSKKSQKRKVEKQ
jgi:large subunit ribosomal protein L18